MPPRIPFPAGGEVARQFWRGLGPVTRTYTAATLGAASPTVRSPDWGGITCDGTTQTASRGGGVFTPVNQGGATWGARHRMRVRVSGTQSGQVYGVGCRISGGGDMYWWALTGDVWYRWHETAGVPGGVSLITCPSSSGVLDVEIYVPERATEADAATVVVSVSGDGFKTQRQVDSLSIAPTHTGLCGSSNTLFATLHAEQWSDT